MVEVQLWGALAAAAGGSEMVEIEAKDIRELFRKLAEQYPGAAGLHRTRESRCRSTATIYRDNWSKELPEGTPKIFLLPRIAGG